MQRLHLDLVIGDANAESENHDDKVSSTVLIHMLFTIQPIFSWVLSLPEEYGPHYSLILIQTFRFSLAHSRYDSYGL
jgi:hypothetical protein